jgi:hypothetical protein
MEHLMLFLGRAQTVQVLRTAAMSCSSSSSSSSSWFSNSSLPRLLASHFAVRRRSAFFWARVFAMMENVMGWCLDLGL